MPAGQPTKYDPAFAEQAFKLCLLGATDEDLYNFFGVCEKTLNNWKRAHPEFLQALKDGKEVADANVGARLYERALGYSHPEDKIFICDGEPLVVPTVKHYPPDTTACIFWLKNRRSQNWRDKNVQEIEPSDALADLLRNIAAGDRKNGLPT